MVEATSTQPITAKLSVEYGEHSTKLGSTRHTIVGTLDGPGVEQITDILTKDPTVTRGEQGALRHGPYVFINYGYRNMIWRLREAGVPLDAIAVDEKPAAEFLKRMWPDGGNWIRPDDLDSYREA